MDAIKFTQQMPVARFDKLFPTDDACKQYLVSRRWPNGANCPRCGNENVYPVTNRPFHWQCTKCVPKGGYRFSVLVGTIFENTNIPMRTWFKVIYLMLTNKTGIAALQVHRMFGFGSYSTAHYMCHRIRAGLAKPEFRKLMGIVEVDETYIGGKGVLDPSSFFVEAPVKAERLLSVAAFGNDWLGSAILQPKTQLAAVVGLVADQAFRCFACGDEPLRDRAVMRFAAGQEDGEKTHLRGHGPSCCARLLSGQSPASAPPFSTRCRAVGFDMRGVDHLEQIFPDPTPRPAQEAVIDRR